MNDRGEALLRSQLPAFLPDATRGVLKSLDAIDLAQCGVRGLMVNSLHLASKPGISSVVSAGGIHRFMGWNGFVSSDSGGYQILSLVQSGLGSVSKKGFSYRLQKGGKTRRLTPEKAIQRQLQLKADIIYCLDFCTHPDQEEKKQVESVSITVEWAKRCKDEFERLKESRREDDSAAPLLFAVVQGGDIPSLREECAAALLEIGFDGYGFGGWPIDESGRISAAVTQVAQLIRGEEFKHGLGIGSPSNLVRAHAAGYTMFDCVMPSRDARRKRLYGLNGPIAELDLGSDDFFRRIYLQDDKHIKNNDPVDEYCDCLTCSHYSRAYLHHLFRINDALALRLATIHNLRFYARLMSELKRRAHPNP